MEIPATASFDAIDGVLLVQSVAGINVTAEMIGADEFRITNAGGVNRKPWLLRADRQRGGIRRGAR